jgi:hypothetical protein
MRCGACNALESSTLTTPKSPAGSLLLSSASASARQSSAAHSEYPAGSLRELIADVEVLYPVASPTTCMLTKLSQPLTEQVAEICSSWIRGVITESLSSISASSLREARTATIFVAQECPTRGNCSTVSDRAKAKKTFGRGEIRLPSILGKGLGTPQSLLLYLGLFHTRNPVSVFIGRNGLPASSGRSEKVFPS